MTQFASGKYALGICDRCGIRCDYTDLKDETVRGRKRNVRVCPDCWDADHPQNFQGTVKADDPQALRNPRPDTGEAESRKLFSWNPVGHPSLFVQAEIGTVTVTTS